MVGFNTIAQNQNSSTVLIGEFNNNDSRVVLRVYEPDFMGGPDKMELKKYSADLNDSEPEVIYLTLVSQMGSNFTARSPDNEHKLSFTGTITPEGMLMGELELNGPDGTERLSSANISQGSLPNAGFEQQNNLTLVLLLGFLFLVSLILLSLYLKKIYNKLYIFTDDPIYGSAEYYPMVRISRRSFLWRHRVIILYLDSIVAIKKWKWKSIAALHEANSKSLFNSYKQLSKKYIYYVNKKPTSSDVFKARDIALEDVRQVIIFPRRLTRTYLLKFKTRSGTFKVTLPEYECHDFIKALVFILPGKTRYARVNLFMLCLVGIVFAAIICLLFYNSMVPIPLWEQAMVWLILLTLICGLPILFVKYDLHRILSASKGRKPHKDLSHRKPLRSNLLAYSLRFMVIASIGLYLYNQFIPWRYEAMLIGSMLLLSIALSQKRTDKLREKDDRKPILYLRSFLDDNEKTLNPCTALSTTLGIDPPYYVLNAYGLEKGLRYKVGKTIIKYLYSFWPSRLIRLFFGNPLDTSEEQLTQYFKRFGLVVAIGKPGEKLTTLGASRVYVTNEEWQQTVIDLLKESQIILLQPSTTNGVWWEIDKVIKECKPENVILCMVNYRKHQEYYENFFRRLKTIKPEIEIPRSIGNDTQTSFITFGKDWQPHILQLKYYSKFRWLFTGNALNLKQTFVTYFKRRNSVA